MVSYAAAATAAHRPPAHRAPHVAAAARCSPRLLQLDLQDDDAALASSPAQRGSQLSVPNDRLSPLHLDGATASPRARGREVIEHLRQLSQQVERLHRLPRQLEDVACSQERLERALGALQQHLRTQSSFASAAASSRELSDNERENSGELCQRADAERARASQANCEHPASMRKASGHMSTGSAAAQEAGGSPGPSAPPPVARFPRDPLGSPNAASSSTSVPGSAARRPPGAGMETPKEACSPAVQATLSSQAVSDAAWGRQAAGGRETLVGRRKSCLRDAPGGSASPEGSPRQEAGGRAGTPGFAVEQARSSAGHSPAARSVVLRQRREFEDRDMLSRANFRRASTRMTSGTFLPHSGLRPMHPDHRTRLILDLVFCVMTLYDCWAVPYQMVWQIEYSGLLLAWTVLTVVWWTVDLVLGFFTGYYRKDRVEMGWRRIARHYLKRFFVINVIAVLADYIVISAGVRRKLSNDSGFGYQMEKVASIFKISRVIRMCLMVRSGRVGNLYARIVNETRQRGVGRQFSTAATVIQLIMLIVWVNHLGACLWHVIGKDAIESWYTDTEKDNPTKAFDYVLSFYWSVSALVAGENIMDVTKTSEVVCTCVFILFGLLFVSILISSLAATVLDFHMSNKERSDKIRTLQQYLHQHEVDAPVAIPIEKQILERMADVSRVSEADVTVLSYLSPALRAELWYSVYGPGLSRSAFIRAVNAVDSSIIKDLCFSENALESRRYDPGSQVFEPGLRAEWAYFINWGSLEYTTGWAAAEASHNTSNAGSTRVHNQQPQEVAPGKWVCEMALHTDWEHYGWMESVTVCEVVTVAPGHLRKVLSSRKELLTIAHHYAEAIIFAQGREHGMLSDLHMAVDHTSIITSMPLKSRVALSHAALQALDKKQHPWDILGMQPRRDLHELEQEVNKGKCDIMLNEEGRVLRSVSLCVVRLVREDGRILAEIGEMNDGKMTMACKLPGTKVRSQELPHDAIRRLIKRQFGHLESQELKRLEETLIVQATRVLNFEEKPSASYGILSRYARNEFQMQIGPEFFAEDPGSKTLARSSSKGSGGRLGLGRRLGQSGDSLNVSQYEVFAKINPEEPDRVLIMAWVDPEAMPFLSSGAGEAKVRDWVYGFRHEINDLVEGSANSAGIVAGQNSLVGRRLSRKHSYRGSPKSDGVMV